MLRRILNVSTSYRVFSSRMRSNDVGGEYDASNEIGLSKFTNVSDRTLEELSEKLDSLLEDKYDEGADVSLTNGVLTVVVDNENIFVINKQTPNRQLWFSSPLSGPKRFDLISGCWIDKHTNTELKELFSKELSELLKDQVKLET